MHRITKSVLSKIDPAQEERDRDIADAEVRGFGVRIRPKNDPTFYFRYQSPKTKKIRLLSIGSVRDIELDTARDLAREYRGYLAKGQDPQDVKRQLIGKTTAELWEKYLSDWAHKKNKPATVEKNKYYWKRFIQPAWATWPVDSITEADAMDLVGRVTGKTTQNRVRSLLQKVFNLALRWKYRNDGINPIKPIEKNKETARDRVLLPEELRALWKSLEKHQNTLHPVVILAKLALLTGGRPVSEIMSARLEWIDWNAKILRLPDSKTGKGEIELTDPAIDIIRSARRVSGCPYLVPGFRGKGPLKSPWAAWRRICREAGISDFTLHDLRHVFGTYANHSGANQRQLMDLLRHASFSTTQRYIQGFKSARRTGSEKTVSTILGYIQDETSTITRGLRASEDPEKVTLQ